MFTTIVRISQCRCAAARQVAARLARRYFAENDRVAPQQALADACMVLEGYAAQETPQRVHLRVAEHDGVVYLDMGDTDANIIEIGDGAWRITNTAPVLFRRTRLTMAMPNPVPGSGISSGCGTSCPSSTRTARWYWLGSSMG